MQLPPVLAWGLTIHKSQGLTFAEGVLVDFSHQPTYQPLETMGLAFVAMSRCRDWVRQAFRRLPSFWKFRKVLQQPLFQWRSLFEQRMDTLHDETMEHYHGMAWTVERDVAAHATWSSQQSGCELSQAELDDL